MTMLDPYLVVDMSDERGLFCGMVLGDLGADVVRIEPPGGNKARLVSPAGSLWAAWARNSRSVIVDADTDQGQAQIRDLVASADFFVESADPGAMAERGLSAAGLLAANPALIYISITPWGQDGPKASVPATDLTIQAASGALAGCGEAGEAPL